MEVIICLIVLVAGVSLYDYFSARRWQQVTSTERNELVFEHRNQAYGAYQIRKDYDTRVVLILASVIFAIGTTFGIYKAVAIFGATEEEAPKIDMATFAIDAPPEEEQETPPPPPEEPPPPMEQTVQFIEPEVVDEPVDTPPQIIDPDVKVSDKTQDGDPDAFPTDDPPPPKEVETVKEEAPLEFPDEPAAFPGNVNQFLADNIRYPPSAIENGVSGKVYLRFVVDAQGDISDVNVLRGIPDCPECSTEAKRVINSMPKWRPAKNKGKAAKAFYNLTVSFKIQ